MERGEGEGGKGRGGGGGGEGRRVHCTCRVEKKGECVCYILERKCGVILQLSMPLPQLSQP